MGDCGVVVRMGAGGGGRIAIYYQSSDFTGTTEAQGRKSTLSGEDGTVFFIDEAANILYAGHSFRFQEDESPLIFSEIVLDSANVSTEGAVSITADVLTMENGASFSLNGDGSFAAVTEVNLTDSTIGLHDSSILTVSNALALVNSSLIANGSQTINTPMLTIDNGSVLTLSGLETLTINDVNVTNSSSITHIPQGKVYLDLDTLTVDSTSSISADEIGHPPGEGPGAGVGDGGGGYGGKGGGTGGGLPYGSALTPRGSGQWWASLRHLL